MHKNISISMWSIQNGCSELNVHIVNMQHINGCDVCPVPSILCTTWEFCVVQFSIYIGFDDYNIML